MIGKRISAMQYLFPRIELRSTSAASSTPAPVVANPPEGVVLMEFADFQKIQLRTARILIAEKVVGADKLLRLEVDIGGETRQIVAGIAQHYQPAEVVGKTIVVVANLKPARIRKIESQGMLLAATSGGQLRLVTVDGEMPTGAVVK